MAAPHWLGILKPRPIATHPGPQQLIARSWVSTRALQALLFVSVCLMFHSLAGSALAKKYPDFAWFWDLPLMQPEAGATILIGLMSLVVLRAQAAATQRPILTYSSVQQSSDSSGLAASGGGVWSVTLQNVGGGSAIIRDGTYRIRDSLHDVGGYDMNYPAAIEFFSRRGMRVGRDYALYTFSAGGAIGPNVQCRIFEAPITKVNSIRVLDIRVEFETMLGDRYCKEVYCIPRVGMDLHVTTAPLLHLPVASGPGDGGWPGPATDGTGEDRPSNASA